MKLMTSRFQTSNYAIFCEFSSFAKSRYATITTIAT